MVARLYAERAPITNKTKKKKRNKPLQDKSNTTGQHNSILRMIFSTQSTNDIIGYGELAQKIRFSITYAHRRQREIKHFHAAGRNFFGPNIEYFHACAYRYGIVGFNVPLDTIIGHFGDDFTGQ